MTVIAQITQEEGPCELHAYHNPITVINEGHHIFPQYLQIKVWGEVRDNRKANICATAHNTVHYGIEHYLANGVFPAHVRGKTRALAQLGIDRYHEALAAQQSA